MTFLPRQADTARTVLNAVSVNASNGWWTGLVRDRDPRTGEIRLRLERWKKNGRKYDNPHTWRVRPDFWEEEAKAVSKFKRLGGESPPGDLPIDEYLSPSEYRLIRKNESRWVAVVRVTDQYNNTRLRLYHWNRRDGSVRQKWTVGRDWSELKRLADRHLKNKAVV
jgi:hypothetical protein